MLSESKQSAGWVTLLKFRGHNAGPLRMQGMQYIEGCLQARGLCGTVEVGAGSSSASKQRQLV